MAIDALKYLEKLNKGPLTFGQALYAIRDTDEITQIEIAKKVGVSRGIICDIEKGRRSPTIHLVLQLADILGYPKEMFLSLAFRDILRKEKLASKYVVTVQKAQKRK